MHEMFNLTRQPKERKPYLQGVNLHGLSYMSWNDVAVKKLQKWRFLRVRHSNLEDETLGSLGPLERQDITKKVQKRMSDCCTLLKRITKLKMWIRKSSLSTLTPTGVASIGSMAPCRSHHRNHTRQEWIIIWSGRNWIPETCKPA